MGYGCMHSGHPLENLGLWLTLQSLWQGLLGELELVPHRPKP